MKLGEKRLMSLARCAGVSALVLAIGITGHDYAFAAIDEIVISARKREETSISAPVVVKAYTAEDLKLQGITDPHSLADFVPGFQIGPAGSVNGSSAALRGYSTGAVNSTSDTAVQFNIDGVTLARGGVARLGTYDLEQIEILKGPQALFFGKNSPAGIISLRTADPTDELFAELSTGYEFNADEVFGQFIVSGPITDRLGARLVGRISDMKGYFEDNPAVFGTGAFARDFDRGPDERQYFGRGTVTYEGTNWDTRAKVGYSRSERKSAPYEFTRRICDGPTPGSGSTPFPAALPYATTCDGLNTDLVSVGGRIGAYDISAVARDWPEDDQQNTLVEQLVGSIESNIEVTDDITVTALTGYFYLDQNMAFEVAVGAAPASGLVDFSGVGAGPFLNAGFGVGVTQNENYRQFSQEVRMATDFDSPINLLAGVYVEVQETDIRSETIIPSLLAGAAAAVPTIALANTPGVGFFSAGDARYNQKGQTYSVFGEVTWDITDTVELSGGARWTQEKKELLAFSTAGINAGISPVPTSVPQITYTNVSPEITLTWRPTDKLTLFGSYKEGFKSGGFNTNNSDISLAAPVGDRAIEYNEELIDGGEVGLKTLLFNDTLRINANVFRYDLDGLQLSRLVSTTGGGGTFSLVTGNAASTSFTGAEIDLLYQPPMVEGLTLTGAVTYNRARYKEFDAPCPREIVGTCTGASSDTRRLDGEQVALAPDWAAAMGFQYERMVTDDLVLNFGASGAYTGQYSIQIENDEHGKQPSYWKVGANVAVSSADTAWQVALIGKNLTDEYTATVGFNDVFGSSDIMAQVGRGRELWLELTFRPTELGKN